MSTSGSYDYTTTMGEIIRDALGLANILDDNEPIPGDMWVYCRRALNDLVNYLAIKDGLWLETEVSVTLTPGTASYDIGDGETVDSPKPTAVVDARNNDEIPLSIVPRSRYVAITNKTQQGRPLELYYRQNRDNGTLYVWPTGDTTYTTITITTRRRIQDFDATGNNPDLPKEWILAIKYLLATAIAPKYLGGLVPPDISERSSALLASLLMYNEETTEVSFIPC